MLKASLLRPNPIDNPRPRKTYLFADVNFKEMGEETESHHNYYHKTRTVEDMTQRNVETIVRLENEKPITRSPTV